MGRILARFFADNDGATAIESALIALLIGIGIIAGLQGLPNALNSLMNNVDSNLD